MADEDKKTDEVVEEKVEEKATEEKTEEETAAKEAEEKLDEAMDKFDKIVNSDDDDSADDNKDGDDDDPAKEEVEEEVKDEKEVTASDDSMDAAVEAIETAQKTEAAKSDEQKATEKAEVAKKATEEAEATEAAKEKPYDCGLSSDPDSDDPFDKALVETLNKQGQAMQDRAKQAEADNDKLLGVLDQQAAQRTLDWLNTKFDALDENFDEALGKGEFDDLEPGSDQQLNRRKVSARMGVLWEAHEKQGKVVPSRNKLFKMAVEKLFDKETKKPEADLETKVKLKKRSKQVLGGASKKGKATQVAKKSMEQAMKDFDSKRDN